LDVRCTSSVLSISWIPSEAIRGASKPAFDVGPFHYDDPPPEVVESPEELEELRAADRFRFANELAGWMRWTTAGSSATARRGASGSASPT